MRINRLLREADPCAPRGTMLNPPARDLGSALRKRSTKVGLERGDFKFALGQGGNCLNRGAGSCHGRAVGDVAHQGGLPEAEAVGDGLGAGDSVEYQLDVAALHRIDAMGAPLQDLIYALDGEAMILEVARRPVGSDEAKAVVH